MEWWNKWKLKGKRERKGKENKLRWKAIKNEKGINGKWSDKRKAEKNEWTKEIWKEE